MPTADRPAGRPRSGFRSKPDTPGTVPDPPAKLNITPTTWKAGTPIHRIHLDAYHAVAFNPGVKGNARFSPISDAGGNPIPTLYGGSSFECAAMETVFHDVPFSSGLKTVDKRKLSGQLYSVLTSTVAMSLADLRNVPLRKLGIERRRLIDTENDCFAQTRKWAAAIHTRHAHVQGLCWTSRQDDRAIAVILFGDRIEPGTLVLNEPSRSLLNDAPTYMALLALADAIGVRVVAGRM